MTTIEAISLIEGSTSADRLFGLDPDARYRELAKAVHPDVAGATNARAVRAFQRLTELYHGKKPAAALETVIGNWVVGQSISTAGNIADVYRCVRKDDPAVNGAFKIARSPKDSDLMEQERFAIKYLHERKPANFIKYLPGIFDSLEASGRRANVISPADGLSLAEIALIFGPALDPRHLIWMLNRSLNILGFIHANGIVHGAVLPCHLIFGPKTHGLTLIDWCYSVTGESKKHIPAAVKEYADLYPAEVSRKQSASPATDIYMLFNSIKSTKAEIPRRLRPLFEWCLASSPTARPSDAWELQERVVEAAAETFGPPQYIPMEIPVT